MNALGTSIVRPLSWMRGGAAVLVALSAGTGSLAWGSFSSRGVQAISAGVTVGGTTFSIQASTLPATAFFGKNVIMPVQLTSAGLIDPANLRVDIVYQLLDPTGNSLSAPTSVPIQFVQNPANKKILKGTAIIPRSALVPIQNGGTIRYIFRARQGASDTVLGAGGISQVPAGSTALASPFQTSIIDHLCVPVGPAGGRLSAPDLSSNDGRTSVTLAPGAVSSADNLCLRVEEAKAWPLGPGGSRAAAIYSITLENNQALAGTAELVLSYPADVSGKVLDINADPGSLGIYWLNQNALSQVNGVWLPLSRATIDTTLHTVTGMTSHFSTFALFAAGAISNADLRPAQRIIMPNGNYQNRKAIFGTGVDEVKIFDVRGRRVKTIPGPTPVWDGTDDAGSIVESGVYIYQYTVGGDRVSGVIGVAK